MLGAINRMSDSMTWPCQNNRQTTLSIIYQDANWCKTKEEAQLETCGMPRVLSLYEQSFCCSTTLSCIVLHLLKVPYNAASTIIK